MQSLRVLGCAMQTLNDQPQLVGLGVGGDTIRVTLEPVGSEEMSRIWTLFPDRQLPHVGRLPRLSGLDRSRRSADGRAAGHSRAAPRRPPRERGGVMPLSPQLVKDRPDALDRRVLFAVELIDPVTQATVYRGVRVRAAGLEAEPIVSHSGRFVWLQEGAAWPEAITVDTGRLPFVPHVAAPPPRPPDIQTATAEARRVRISLRPTTSYPIEEGHHGHSWSVVETASPGSPPVAGARVQLAWRDEFGNWSPLPPPPEIIGPGEPPSPREQETTPAGEFLVFLNLRPDPARSRISTITAFSRCGCR